MPFIVIHKNETFESGDIFLALVAFYHFGHPSSLFIIVLESVQVSSVVYVECVIVGMECSIRNGIDCGHASL
jgi:hypothetical protein